jgi:hypothetical protein
VDSNGSSEIGFKLGANGSSGSEVEHLVQMDQAECRIKVGKWIIQEDYRIQVNIWFSSANGSSRKCRDKPEHLVEMDHRDHLRIQVDHKWIIWIQMVQMDHQEVWVQSGTWI